MDHLSTALIAVFALLELKHFIFDYLVQTPYQFRNKGIYGHPGGFLHAGLQALGTTAAFLAITPTLMTGIAIVVGEFIVHYHIDWTKEQWLRRAGYTPTDGAYWRIYGLDQFAHQATYVVIAAILVGQFVPAAALP
ncbi:MAG: DUF3307 domain-containing protein [Bauldia sp.]